MFEIFFVTLLYCGQSFHYDKWVSETLVRSSVFEIGDFPSYVNWMLVNYFYKVVMSLSICAV